MALLLSRTACTLHPHPGHAPAYLDTEIEGLGLLTEVRQHTEQGAGFSIARQRHFPEFPRPPGQMPAAPHAHVLQTVWLLLHLIVSLAFPSWTQSITPSPWLSSPIMAPLTNKSRKESCHPQLIPSTEMYTRLNQGLARDSLTPREREEG